MADLIHTLEPETLVAHHEWMRRLARSLVFDDSEADDVVQEAWLRATQTPPERPGALRAWLATVVRNAAKQLARGESRRGKREFATARSESLPSTSELVARAESRRLLMDATLALDEPGRSTILLRFYEGLPPREIAKRQGVPVETVRSRVRRALEEMRKTLDGRHRGDRKAWALALVPLAGPAIPGALPPAVPGAPAVPISAIPLAATAASVLIIGGAAGWLLAPASHDADLAALQAQVSAVESSASGLADEAEALRSQARQNADSARRLRMRSPSRRGAGPVAPAADSATTRPGGQDETATVDTDGAKAPAGRFAFPGFQGVLADQDWEREGRAFAELIRAVRVVAIRLAAGDAPTPAALAEIQIRNAPIAALALRVQAAGIQTSSPNSALAHPAVLANLLPPTMKALGFPLTDAQLTALRRAAQDGLDELDRARAELDGHAILLRRIAVEAAALGPWLESVNAILSERQRAALRNDASRGRAGLDLVSPGMLWSTMRPSVAADASEKYVQALDALLLAPAFPDGSPERAGARQILVKWADALPAKAFTGAGGTMDAYGFAQAERFAFWAEQTADLLENLRDGAAVTPAQRERLARRFMPLVPLVPALTPGGSPR